jgi:hypothetical protein
LSSFFVNSSDGLDTNWIDSHHSCDSSSFFFFFFFFSVHEQEVRVYVCNEIVGLENDYIRDINTQVV